MKKVIAIINNQNKTENAYLEQIRELFFNYADVIEYCCGSEEIKNGINGDIVILQSLYAFNKVKTYINKDSKLIFAGRTLSKEGFEKILNIPSGSDVILLDENKEMAEEIIKLLLQKGIRSIKLTAGSLEDIREIHDKDFIVMGFSNSESVPKKNLIDIGKCFLDANTLVNIADELELTEIISKQNIEKGSIDIISNNIGLSNIMEKTNSIESQTGILLQICNDGVIGIDLSGNICTFNEKAEKVIGVKKVDVLHKNGINIFPEIPFKNVMLYRESIKDKVIRINNHDIIVTVDPLIHSQKLYGAIGTVKKFNDEELRQHKLRAQLIGKGHKAKYTFENILGENELIKRSKYFAAKMAQSNSTILIYGESGTGKELFAQAIHNSSSRNDYQFVAVNCGAIPENLLESELFGYEEGAFTGARKGGKTGLFELAHKGTLFLDEIGEMPMNLQMRLLRVLQEREVMRIGGDSKICVDIRLITATNRNLMEMIRQNRFREDLYYRLNVVQLKIPPLRSYKEDIPIFLKAFMKEFGSAFTLTEDAEKAFANYEWKGNVRELKNCVEYLVNIGLDEISKNDLPFEEDSMEGEVCTIEDYQEDGMLLRISGNKQHKYFFILNELRDAYENHTRLGRRSISENARAKSIYISEREVRNILEDLQKNKFIEISKGRMGSIITEDGKRVLDNLKDRKEK